MFAVIIVGVVCGVFFVGMIGFCLALLVYRYVYLSMCNICFIHCRISLVVCRWKWYSRTYKIPITSPAERQEMEERQGEMENNTATRPMNGNNRQRGRGRRHQHGSVSSG